MKTMTILNENIAVRKKKNASRDAIIDFYNEATEDYSFWSNDLNMHFGYFKFGKTSPFKRDSMCNEMNNQLFKRLKLSIKQSRIIDLGCGMGGTMRYILSGNKSISAIGVTLSSFQVKEGNKLLKNKNGKILLENYCNTSIENSSADGVLAIESLCHSGHSKQALTEAHRLLKPGANFVIADAFLKRNPSKLCKVSRHSYNKLCKGWSLDGLGVISNVKKDLEEIGFKNISIENISHRVAISVLHVPFAICGFILKNIWQKKNIKLQSWNNMRASFYALLSGIHLKDFGYYIITATK